LSQHDLSIANQGFPAFRSDLNDALQALGSMQSGTTAPSTTYANMLWYDTTNNIVKMRNEDNDAWISLITLDQTNDIVAAVTATLATFVTLSVTGNATLGDSSSDTLTVNAKTTFGSEISAPNTFGFKNRIINGAMMIDARNAGASVTNTVGVVFPVDRFGCYGDQASKFTGQQSSVVPAGFVNSLLITSLSAYSVPSGEIFLMRQRIEGFNVADLGWGTANAQSVTLSFWVRSSLTGTFGGSVQNSAQNRSYPFTYTISAANTWEQKTITIAADTSGTWVTNNGVGLTVNLGLGVGSTYSGTAGAWSGSTYYSATGATSVVGTSGATFYITGVQLEKGSTATSFDYRPYGTELALCQRYCWNYSSAVASGGYSRFSYGETLSTVQYQGGLFFPVQMRTTPSLTAAASSNYAIFSRASVVACNSGPTIGDGTTVNSGLIVAGVASGLTVGNAGSFMANNNNTAYLLYTAEL
jgi:hypothetical protein